MLPQASLSWPPVQRILFVSPHGIGSAAGFLAGAALLLREVRRRGDLDEQVVVRALTWAAFGAIVGARLDYVVSHPGDWESVWDALALWEGGLALFGGFIGGVLAALPILIRAKVHLPRFLDAAAPGFALGVVIGRIGDLVIWDHLGDVAHGAWRTVGLTIKEGYDLAPGFGPSPAVPLPAGTTCDQALEQSTRFYAGCTYHQPAMYDLLGALVLFGVLLLIRRRARARAGVSILTWGAWYGVQRFSIDFTRSIDERIGGLTGTQWLAAILAVFSITTLLVIAARKRGLREEPGDPPSRAGALVRQPSSSSEADSAASSAPSA
ncbi:MAG TPA: prolipoprotein diacylglyceryl transferase family protein [Frankiaceae bacterium]|nr:prolipoprotein diacylglyceryl transferase family protein [Frankiaceae bacterium]